MASFGEICSNSYFKLGEKLFKTIHLPNILWRQKLEISCKLEIPEEQLNKCIITN